MSHVYIVAGGPSLGNFDWSLLADKEVIAVNRAFEVLPYAKFIYFSDLRFWNWHHQELLLHSGHMCTGAKRVKHANVENFRFTGMRGLDVNYGGLRSGNNSGYAAINLAYHMGYKIIYLLGFDMKFMNGQSHWHNGYQARSLERVFDKMIKCFDTLVEPLKEVGVEVYNANSESKLECFSKITIEDAFYGCVAQAI